MHASSRARNVTSRDCGVSTRSSVREDNTRMLAPQAAREDATTVPLIGINAPDVIIDTNIKGSKFIGLLKFKKNIPIPIEPYKITI